MRKILRKVTDKIIGMTLLYHRDIRAMGLILEQRTCAHARRLALDNTIVNKAPMVRQSKLPQEHYSIDGPRLPAATGGRVRILPRVGG